MAKFDGIFEIQGTLKGMTFYKTKNGSFIRTKGGVSKERIMNDPAFVRTRENGTEFKHVAQSGQLIRKSTGKFYKLAKDSKVVSRLVSLLSQVKKLDSSAARGERLVSTGLALPEGRALLKGFDFNQKSVFNYVFRGNYQLDNATGTFSVDPFVPMDDLYYPEGATHVRLSNAVSRLDFSTGAFQSSFSTVSELALDDTPTSLSLVPSSVPAGDGFLVFYILIEFLQEINGGLYPLKNHAFNVLHVVDVVA